MPLYAPGPSTDISRQTSADIEARFPSPILPPGGPTSGFECLSGSQSNQQFSAVLTGLSPHCAVLIVASVLPQQQSSPVSATSTRYSSTIRSAGSSGAERTGVNAHHRGRTQSLENHCAARPTRGKLRSTSQRAAWSSVWLVSWCVRNMCLSCPYEGLPLSPWFSPQVRPCCAGNNQTTQRPRLVPLRHPLWRGNSAPTLRQSSRSCRRQ